MRNIINVVGYVRVGAIENSERGCLLEAQKCQIRDYCLSKGYNLINIYVDYVSGIAVRENKIYKLMIKDFAKTQCVDAVIIANISRLSRTISDLALVHNDFSNNQVELIIINGNFESAVTSNMEVIYAEN